MKSPMDFPTDTIHQDKLVTLWLAPKNWSTTNGYTDPTDCYSCYEGIAYSALEIMKSDEAYRVANAEEARKRISQFGAQVRWPFTIEDEKIWTWFELVEDDLPIAWGNFGQHEGFVLCGFQKGFNIRAKCKEQDTLVELLTEEFGYVRELANSLR